MRLLVLASMFAAACGGGGGGSGGSDSGGGGSSGSTSASGESAGGSSDGGTDTGGVDPQPILERDPVISHDCTNERAMTMLADTTSARIDGLVAHGGAFALVVAGETLDIEPIALDGTTGDPVVIESDMFAFRGAIARATPAGIAVTWTHLGADERLRFALLDDSLGFVVDPIDVPETADKTTTASVLLAEGDGFVLFYASAGGAGDTTLYRLALDGGGQAVGAPLAITALGQTYGWAMASAAPTGDGGHALAYVGGAPQGSEVFFVVLDADGAPRFDARRISRAGGDGWTSDLGTTPRGNVLAVGDAYWVTFTEGWYDYGAMQGHSTVMLAQVDGSGDAHLHSLQAPVDGSELRWPSLTMLDDRVALSWTSGTIIWICGGCISDYDLHLVLLDPDAIVPASEVVTQLHMTNGITSPIVAVAGADVLTASSLDFHALTRPASGALRCVPQG